MNDAATPSAPPAPAIPALGASDLLERFDAVLLDAYGVLVDADGALPGAGALVRQLAAQSKPWLVVTNDASRSPETSARRFQSFGLPVGPERVVSSGMLLAPYFAAQGLRGAGTLVLGPEDTHAYVRQAGGVIVPFPTDDAERVRVVVLGDESGFPLLEALDTMLSLVVRRLDRGLPTDIVVPNPDLLYPKSGERFGFAAGSFGVMLEATLALFASERALPPIVRLGKPHPPIFAEALRRTGTAPERTAMVGDQLETDVRGANAAGIVSVLVMSGVARVPLHAPPAEIRPRYLLVSP